jgi:hypothetical protein
MSTQIVTFGIPGLLKMDHLILIDAKRSMEEKEGMCGVDVDAPWDLKKKMSAK